MLVNLHAALTFMFDQPHFRRSLKWGGLMMLICPPIGWIIALGYRSLLFNHLIDGLDRSALKLPERNVDCFVIGLKAVGVIYAYYLPFLTLFLLLAVDDPLLHPLELLIFYGSIPLFLPLCMVGVPAYYLRYYPWVQLESVSYLPLAMIFALTTFLMPAAFMQVGLHGRYLAAFYLRKVVQGLCAKFVAYCEAWLYSAAILGLTVLAFPIFPWITFWAYLVFGFLFLNCAYLLKNERSEARFQRIRRLFDEDSTIEGE